MTVTDEQPVAMPDGLAELKAVVGRARRGDASAVPRLRELLDAHPTVWQAAGDLAARAERAWVTLTAGGDLHQRESVTRAAAELRAGLTRPSAGAAEKLLAERVVATWLQTNYFAAMEAQAIDAGAGVGVRRWQAERQRQAQRQHERAIAALLTVQKLFPVPVALPSSPLPQTVSVSSEPPVTAASSHSGPDQAQNTTAVRGRLALLVADDGHEANSLGGCSQRVQVSA